MAPESLLPKERLNREWFRKHEHFIHQSVTKKPKNILIGDSLFANFKREEHSDIWEKFFEKDTINLSIGGDKIENALWRVINGELPKYALNVFLLIGTNNIGKNNAEEIATGIDDLMVSIK